MPPMDEKLKLLSASLPRPRPRLGAAPQLPAATLSQPGSPQPIGSPKAAATPKTASPASRWAVARPGMEMRESTCSSACTWWMMLCRSADVSPSSTPAASSSAVSSARSTAGCTGAGRVLTVMSKPSGGASNVTPMCTERSLCAERILMIAGDPGSPSASSRGDVLTRDASPSCEAASTTGCDASTVT